MNKKTTITLDWSKIIPWAIAAIFILLFIRNTFFSTNKIPPKVETTADYINAKRKVDSLSLLIVRKDDSLTKRNQYVRELQVSLIQERAGYKKTQKELDEILNTPDNKLPVLSDIEITNWLKRKYGDGSQKGIYPNDGG